MSDMMILMQQISPWVRELHVNPWAAIILAGLLAAWMEQRRVARRVAPFTQDHIGVAGRPGAPR